MLLFTGFINRIFTDPFEQFDIWLVSFYLLQSTNACISLFFFFILCSLISQIFLVYKSNYNNNYFWVLLNFIKIFKNNIINYLYYLHIKLIYSWLFLLIVFIFGFNLLGMLPLNIIFTSFWCITLLYSLTFFFFGNTINIILNGINSIRCLVPLNIPKNLFWLLIPLEFISHINKVFSLGIRLFSNILSGHILLSILESFLLTSIFSTQYYLIYIFSLQGYILFFFITLLEFAISFLQTYVFITLLLFYYKESFILFFRVSPIYIFHL